MSLAPFTLRGHNPDVLTCIANLSNDEVFTPPEFASKMLDTLAAAWADANDGDDIWTNPDVTFLDPFAKSGVYLREIVRRLTDGLISVIPDLAERVDHILTRQVFGIGITQLTALLARRSIYCSKFANGPHSIAKSFKTEDGNIWFERTEHTWGGGKREFRVDPLTSEEVAVYTNRKCIYCGANERDYERGGELESHAYALIHTEDVHGLISRAFGENMRFDVVIGNPPYQLGQSGGESVGSFAMPIYQKFVDAAKGLDPRFVTMVIPSRWFAGGRGLDEFRQEMLTDRRLRVLVDHPNSREVFDGVDIAGGVSYFLWDASWNGTCEVTTVKSGEKQPSMRRYLDEYDILVRYNEAVSILHRVLRSPDPEPFESLASHVAPIQPFSIRTNFRGAETSVGMQEPVRLYQNGGSGWIEREAVPRNVDWVDQWKVFLSGTASEHGGQTDKSGTRRVFSRIIVAEPGTACTETYLVADRFDTEQEAVNFADYLRTRFVRFLVSLRTNTQHLYNERFAFVPSLPMDRSWTDRDLYERYGLREEEIAYIESNVKPMETEG